MVGSGQASEDAELAQVHGEACMQAVCGLDVSIVMWREHGLGLPFAPESALLLSPVLAVTFFSGPLLTAPPLVGHSLMVKAGASL